MGIISGGRKIECLEKLGIYRNQIMHLGIDVNEDFAELLAVIHESFYLIIDDNFYSGLLEISDYFRITMYWIRLSHGKSLVVIH